ncbi:MAG TPA: hypothetical protein VG456_26225, partial [Candidatus Sulfopaludibacter sp.]|nr:hypothetical protein [Candidatus Sulfopaludibacter sp.]
MKTAPLLLFWGACLYAQQGSLEGIVVNRLGGKALAGVHVRLLPAGINGPGMAYGAISDKTGHFSISSIPAGSYLMLPEYTGFLYTPSKSDSPLPGIQIKAGQHIQDYRLEMSPRALLAGRVLDEFGDPVNNVMVSAIGASPDEWSLNIFGMQQPSTDDRGEFRLTLAPGKYYLKAQPNGTSNAAPEIRTDGTTEAVYGATFFPSAAGQDAASVIEAAAGSDQTGLDIRLTRQRTFTISGVVTGIPNTAGSVQVTMRFGESAQQLNSSRGDQAGPGGKFSFARLSPGFYRLSARFLAAGQQMQSPPVEIKLDGGDETNVQLVLAGNADITGTLELTGLPAEPR